MEFDTKTSNFNNTIVPWLGVTTKMLHHYITDVFHKNQIQLTKQQWIVLKILFENSQKKIIQNDLAFITNRNKASLTRLINSMEKNNLLKRIPSENDCRKNLITLTPTGTNLFLKTEPILLKSIDKIQNNISNEEMEFFKNLINKIQTNLKKQTS